MVWAVERIMFTVHKMTIKVLSNLNKKDKLSDPLI